MGLPSLLKLLRGGNIGKSAISPELRKQVLEGIVDLFFVGLMQFAFSTIAATFFHPALSDDDYARVVISQRWVSTFSPDPSGSSWLPFPFYLQGGFLWLTDSTLEAARNAAKFSGILSAAFLYLGARLLGNSRWLGLSISLVVMALPLSLWTSTATIPAYLTSCLLVLAISAASRSGFSFEILSAFCVFLATGCRYEAWPFAFALSSLFTLRHYRVLRTRPYYLIPILLSCAFCFMWLAHGVFIHDDPFFFVQRVRDYKLALNPAAGSVSLLDASISLPIMAWRYFPLSCACLGISCLLLLIPTLRRQFSPIVRQRLTLTLTISGVLPVFLWLGMITGGVPTHHPERALLSLGLLFPVLLSSLLGSCSKATAITWGLFLLSGLYIQFVPVQTWSPQRAPEEKAGGYIAAQIAADAAVLISTPDYGYFALMAAAGHPERFTVLDSQDPRARSTPEASSPLSRAHRVRAELEQHEATWALISPPLAAAAEAGLQTAADWGHKPGILRLYRVREEENKPLGGTPAALQLKP